MKKIRITLAAAVILLLFFTSCEKIHRYHYTGKWDFMVVYTTWVGGYSTHYTTYYSGKINIAAAYNKLTIKYLEDAKITMEINECGELNKEYDDPHEFAYGQFYGNNKVEIGFGYAALGGGSNHTIYGIKK